MFAGHIGAALAIGRAERHVNVAAFIFAGLFLDLVLWILVLLGRESVAIPGNFLSTHQPQFVFPYSHGLVAAIAWSLLAGAAAFFWFSGPRRAGWRAAILVALAVLSHWFLDALVHVPELPLMGAASAKVGLGLWNSMPQALAAETVLVLAGLGLFMPGCRLSPAKKISLTVLTLLTLGFTVAGMTVAPPPPSVTAMAASSLITILVVSALTWWLGKPST